MPVELSNNLIKVKTILDIVGTPFNPPKQIQLNTIEISDLYATATKNKVGLLFLESLAKYQDLEKFASELKKQRENQYNQRGTAIRAASILNQVGCRYAIVKSNYPFPAVPNDVDLLILDDSNRYKEAVQAMKDNFFHLVGDEAPLEVCLHDSTRAKHFDDPTKTFASKDPFDVDIYKEIGASHIIYMDKTKLFDEVAQTTIDNTKVYSLTGPSEIVLEIFHSIFPERIYTLLLHFHILHVLKEMGERDKADFFEICREHRIQYPARLSLSITEKIQELCFGECPSKITDLREGLGKRIEVRIDRIPYLYPMKMVFDSFWHKRNDLVFSLSAIRQIISMLNPEYLNYVIKVHRDRANRDTY